MTRLATMLALLVAAGACTSARKDVGPTVGSGPSGGGTAPGDAAGSGGGGGGGGRGAGGEAGAGGAAPCLDVGEPCDGGVCVQVVDAGGTRLACADGDACVPDAPCGVDGVCLVVVTADGVETACADGEPGDPCAGDGDCDSGICDAVTDPAGARTVCQ